MRHPKAKAAVVFRLPRHDANARDEQGRSSPVGEGDASESDVAPDTDWSSCEIEGTLLHPSATSAIHAVLSDNLEMVYLHRHATVPDSPGLRMLLDKSGNSSHWKRSVRLADLETITDCTISFRERACRSRSSAGFHVLIRGRNKAKLKRAAQFVAAFASDHFVISAVPFDGEIHETVLAGPWCDREGNPVDYATFQFNRDCRRHHKRTVYVFLHKGMLRCGQWCCAQIADLREMSKAKSRERWNRATKIPRSGHYAKALAYKQYEMTKLERRRERAREKSR